MDVKKIRPLRDQVLIKRNAFEERTKSGLILPPVAADRELIWDATVIAVGPGRRLDNGEVLKPCVKKDDKILIGKYTGVRMTIDGEEYFMVRESDLHGVVVDPTRE